MSLHSHLWRLEKRQTHPGEQKRFCARKTLSPRVRPGGPNPPVRRETRTHEGSCPLRGAEPRPRLVPLGLGGRSVLTTEQRCALCPCSPVAWPWCWAPPSGCVSRRSDITRCRPGDEGQPSPPQRPTARIRGPGVLAVSGRVVWPGDQDNFLVHPAERLQLGIERAAGGPHNQNPVVWSQEFQDFGKLFLQAFRFDLGAGERGMNEPPGKKRVKRRRLCGTVGGTAAPQAVLEGPAPSFG